MTLTSIFTRLAAIVLAGSPALAEEITVILPEAVVIEVECTYTTECLTGEACQETEFEMQVALAEVSDGPLVDFVSGTFSTVSGTLKVSGFHKDGTLSINGGGYFPASHLITIGKDGNAIYTTHLDPTFGITYLGSCT